MVMKIIGNCAAKARLHLSNLFPSTVADHTWSVHPPIHSRVPAHDWKRMY